MPAIVKVYAGMPAPTPDTPCQGTVKTSLCTLRLFPTARSPRKGGSGVGACALESGSSYVHRVSVEAYTTIGDVPEREEPRY